LDADNGIAKVMPLTWQRLLQILLARHWVVWLPCLLATGAAIGYTKLVLNKYYTASAEVLLDFRESDPVQGQMQTPSLISPGYVATQADIIMSDRVARKVVRALGLDTNAASVQQWHDAGASGSVEQYYMDNLRRSLDVRPSRMSNVLAVKFSSPSANYAATVANAFAKAYIDTNVELKADPARDFKVWFDARTAQVREQLEKAQARLSAYQRDKGIVVASDNQQLDVEAARLSELSTALAIVQGQHAESESRRDQAEGELGNSPDVLQSALVSSLRGELARAEAKQDELSREFGRNHPNFKSAEAQVASLREKLEAEIHRVAASISGSNSVNVQKEQQIRAALEAQKKRVLQLRAQRDEASVLRNDVESAQRAYDLALQRVASTNLESQVQQTNVSLLSEALPPVKPAGPNAVLNALLGLSLGLLAGTIAAILLEFRRPRLRSIGDIVTVLNVPVLVAIPRVKRAKAASASAGRTAMLAAAT
jgi:chain length determinant protein EpsF